MPSDIRTSRGGAPGPDGRHGSVPLRVTWGLPPAGIELPADEIHVALTLLERPAWPREELEELLCDSERAQAGRFRFEADRRRFAVSRGMLRLWLSRYTGTPPAELQFLYGGNGKPALAAPHQDLHFNLSHAGGLVAFAVTRAGEVGIDLEQIHDLPGWEQISVLCFAPAERALLIGVPAAERQHQFFRLWTRHEAWLKAWGIGLGSDDPAVTDAWARPGQSGLLETFEPAPGYLATVALLFPDAVTGEK